MASSWLKNAKVVDTEESKGGSWLDRAKSVDKAPEESQAQAALEAGGGGLLFGHAAQVQSKLEPLTDRLFNFFSKDQAEAAPISQLTENGPEYIKARDENLARQARQKEQFPITTGASEIAGTLVGSAVPGAAAGKLIKGAGLLSRIGQGAITAGAGGLLQNPGDVKGEVQGAQVGERLGQGVKQGAVGAVVPAVIGGTSKALSGLLGGKDTAGKVALKGAGAMLKDLRAADNQGRIDDLGKFLLDEKLVTPGSTVQKVSTKAKAIADQSGKELGEIYNTVQAKIKDPKFFESLNPQQQERVFFSGYKPASDLGTITETIKKGIGNEVNAEAAINKSTKYLQGLAEQYGDDLDPKTAHQIRQSIDRAINYESDFRDSPAAQKALRIARKFIDDKTKDQIAAIDEVIGGDLGNRLKVANKRFALSHTIADMAEDKTFREAANRGLSLTDYLAAGATGGAIGGPAGVASAVVGAGANKMLRKYGPGLLAPALNTLGETPNLATPVSAALRMREKRMNNGR